MAPTSMGSGEPIVRRPGCGAVQGLAEAGVARFLGIPFAESPVGRRRFEAPQAKAPWQDVFDARRYGPTAPQPARGVTLIPEPEEAGDAYLNLNVFAPATLPDAPLPVYVYIHGGGFFGGCNRSPWFDGGSLVQQGIIVVSPSYRLGVEGFLPVSGAPHNRAVLDWLSALHWVRDNIAAFGGDPQAVTLGGQSAGGGAVATLMAAPAAAGLFQRAILHSGSIGFGGGMARAQAFGERFSRSVGRPLEIDALADLPSYTLVSGFAAAMQDAAATRPGEGFLNNAVHGLPMQPLAGTETLPVAPVDAFCQGTASQVPVLLTTTHDEFVFEFDQPGARVDEQYLGDGLAALGLDAAAQTRYRSLYPDHGPARLLGQAATDRLFRAPMMRMAWLRRDIAAAPTWTAEFRHESTAATDVALRAAHCLDMPFYYDKLGLASAHRVLGPTPPATLGGAMHASLTGFIREGDPGFAPWTGGDATQVWNSPDGGTTTDMNTLPQLFRM